MKIGKGSCKGNCTLGCTSWITHSLLVETESSSIPDLGQKETSRILTGNLNLGRLVAQLLHLEVYFWIETILSSAHPYEQLVIVLSNVLVHATKILSRPLTQVYRKYSLLWWKFKLVLFFLFFLIKELYISFSNLKKNLLFERVFY